MKSGYHSKLGAAVAIAGLSVTVNWGSPKAEAQGIDLESGLEAYWTFDEGEGDAGGDVTGNGRGSFIHDAPAFAESSILWMAGRFGGAIEFDGTYFLSAMDYFGVGGTGPRTISAWVKTEWEATNQGVLVAWGPNVNEQRWHFKMHSTAALRTENQGGNNYSETPINDGEWHHIVSVFPEGGTVVGDVDHYLDGVLEAVKEGGLTNPVDTNVDPESAPEVSIGGSPFDAGFRFTQAILDDVRVYSRALSADEIAALAEGQGVVAGAPPSIGIPAELKNAPFYEASQGVVMSVKAIGEATLGADGIGMSVNGADVTADLEITGSDTELSVKYDGLEPNLMYSVLLSATDSNNMLSKRSVAFSTFSEDNYTVEAENFNFNGGEFIDDPVLCNMIGGAPDCYFDRVSEPAVDSFDSNGFTDDASDLEDLDNIYRYSAGGAEREEEFDTYVTGDFVRSKYEGNVGDYEIDRLNASDWANYTRTFPEGVFNVYLRVSAGANQTVLLDRVVGNTSAPDQSTESLGYFHVESGSGFSFVPLTDLTGESMLTPTFSGEDTVRITTEDANANISINFLMFVPAETPAIPPTVSLEAPADGSVHPTGGDIVVRANAEDPDGTVEKVTFFAARDGQTSNLGEVATSPFEIVWPAVAAGIYTLTAEAVDNDGLSGVAAPVTVIVDSEPPEISAVRGSPGLDAIEVIYNEPVDPASAGNVGNYSTDPSLSISSATVAGQRVTLATGAQSQGVEYTVTAKSIEDANGILQPETSGSFTASDISLGYGLELYLTFDEGAGAVAGDLSGFGRNASVYDAPEYAGESILWTEGRFNGAVDFNGSYFLGAPDYFGVGGANPRTISMWIKTDWEAPTGGNALMGWGANANEQRYHFKLENTNGGALRTENQGGNNFADVPVTDGEWHHIVAVLFDGGVVVGDVDHYIDGELDPAKNGGVDNPVNTNVDPAVAAPVTVGGAPLGLGGALRPVIALLDDVRLYSRELSEAEIQALARGEGVVEGPSGPSELAIELNGDGTITITWTGGGTLQTTSALGEDWSDLPDASSPYTTVVEGTAFFRLVAP